MEQCKNLQSDLQAKAEKELQFNEKIANLERHCLEQEEVTKILREEKTALQNTTDSATAEAKALNEEVNSCKIQQEEQTEMIMKKSEQNQALENQILIQTYEIDNLKDEIKQKVEEYQASKKFYSEFEEQMSSKSVEFSTI